MNVAERNKRSLLAMLSVYGDRKQVLYSAPSNQRKAATKWLKCLEQEILSMVEKVGPLDPSETLTKEILEKSHQYMRSAAVTIATTGIDTNLTNA